MVKFETFAGIPVTITTTASTTFGQAKKSILAELKYDRLEWDVRGVYHGKKLSSKCKVHHMDTVLVAPFQRAPKPKFKIGQRIDLIRPNGVVWTDGYVTRVTPSGRPLIFYDTYYPNIMAFWSPKQRKYQIKTRGRSVYPDYVYVIPKE